MILSSQKQKPVSINSIIGQGVLKYKQIAQTIIDDIEQGKLKVNDKLLSITKFSVTNAVSRDTVERAYNELRRQGYIKAVKSKGFFVVKRESAVDKILVLTASDKNIKNGIYESVMERLNTHFKLELGTSHHDFKKLREIISSKAKKGYSCVVILP